MSLVVSLSAFYRSFAILNIRSGACLSMIPHVLRDTLRVRDYVSLLLASGPAHILLWYILVLLSGYFAHPVHPVHKNRGSE